MIKSPLSFVESWNSRLVGFATLIILAVVSTVSADIALKSQYFITPQKQSRVLHKCNTDITLIFASADDDSETSVHTLDSCNGKCLCLGIKYKLRRARIESLRRGVFNNE